MLKELQIGNIIKKTKIIPDFINVGGDLTIYPDLRPQSLDNYFEKYCMIRKLKIRKFTRNYM